MRIHENHLPKKRYQTYWLRDEAAKCVDEVGILAHVNAERQLTAAEVTRFLTQMKAYFTEIAATKMSDFFTDSTGGQRFPHEFHLALSEEKF